MNWLELRKPSNFQIISNYNGLGKPNNQNYMSFVDSNKKLKDTPNFI